MEITKEVVRLIELIQEDRDRWKHKTEVAEANVKRLENQLQYMTQLSEIS